MEALENAAKLFEQPNLVTITLDDGSTFFVQAPLLCRSSDYFRKALSGGFKEDHTKTLRLPGCDKDTFKHMLFWILNGDVQTPDHEDCSEEAQLHLVRLWAAGDMYLLPALQNRAMKRLREMFEHDFVSVDAAVAAFETTSPGSKLREVMVGTFVEEYLDYVEPKDDESIDRLASIPGFMKLQMSMLEDRRNEKTTSESWKYELNYFLVPETV